MNPEELKFWAEVDALTKPIIPVTFEYRIYYNELNEITSCSMSNHPEAGQYLIVDKLTYDNYFQYEIVNGKLNKIEIDAGYLTKLLLATNGHTVVKNHAGLLLEETETYNEIEHYAYRNN